MIKHESDILFTNPIDAMDNALNKLDAEGIPNGPGMPSITIIVASNGTFTEGEELPELKTVVYIDATQAEIAEDMLATIPG
jgi:hypothetical protein